MLREPLSRAVSHFGHCLRAHKGCLGGTRSLDDFVHNELQGNSSLQCINRTVAEALQRGGEASSALGGGGSGGGGGSKGDKRDRGASSRKLLDSDSSDSGSSSGSSGSSSSLSDLPVEAWWDCYQDCAFMTKRSGLRCPNLDQDVPVSRWAGGS
jgi:hypothetical protein